MSNYFKLLLAGALAATSLSACNLGVPREGIEDAQGYYFEGNIYNGVTSARITDYSITATQRGENVTASVNGDGLFEFGPILPSHDYTITIEADGYREFFSVQAGESFGPSSIDGQRTQYFEAFLFPTDIESPEVQLSFYTPDGATARPTGSLRLTPSNGADLSALHLSTVGSVTGQVWGNDADRRERTVILEVVDGEVTVEAGALVYGVAYTGTVFGADGYTFNDFTYVSGLEGDRTVNLGRLDPQALALTSSSVDIDARNEDATVVFTFNQAIEFDDVVTEDARGEEIDSGFSISSPDFDDDGDTNVLVTTLGGEVNVRERGTNITIEGNTLTLTWERDASNFDTTDTDDFIEYVTYGNLDEVILRPAGGRFDQEVTLSALLGGDTSVRVYVDGEQPSTNTGPILYSTEVVDNFSWPDASITYYFNQPIELVDTVNPVVLSETIDNAFSIFSPNFDADLETNALNTSASATISERGTQITVAGTSVTLSWSSVTGLATADVDDPINYITFGGLGSVQIRPVGNTSNTRATTLSAFVGTTVNVFP